MEFRESFIKDVIAALATIRTENDYYSDVLESDVKHMWQDDIPEETTLLVNIIDGINRGVYDDDGYHEDLDLIITFGLRQSTTKKNPKIAAARLINDIKKLLENSITAFVSKYGTCEFIYDSDEYEVEQADTLIVAGELNYIFRHRWLPYYELDERVF